MPLLRLFLLLLLATPAVARAEPPVVYVMRHLHTPEGARDPELTEEGRRHAEALDRRLRGKRVAAIYVSDFRRTRRTVAPLAGRLRLAPKIYDPANTPALLAAVRAETGPVLVVGHSNTVPDIVEGLGGARPAPLSHPDFGDIWTIRRGVATRDRISG